MDPQTQEQIRDYIWKHRYVYTREALDQQMLDAGYTKEEIEAAWKQVLAEDARDEQPQPVVNRPSGCLLSIVVGTMLIAGIIVLGLTNLGLSLSSGYPIGGRSTSYLLQWFVNIGSLVVLIGLVAAGSRLANRKGWNANQIAGLVAAVAIVWYLIVLGICNYGRSL